MVLDREVAYPVRRHYVLKLDRLADPAQGVLSGRLENLTTGEHFDFSNVAMLLDGLALELSAQGNSSFRKPV